MTAQINDRVFHRKINFSMIDSHGEGLFEPSMHGIDIEPLRFRCTALNRGYFVMYAIEQDQLVLSQVSIGMEYRYDGRHEPVAFTGVLFLGGERLWDGQFPRYGLRSCDYREVWQVRFDEGRVIEDLDRSREVEELRAQFSKERARKWGDP